MAIKFNNFIGNEIIKHKDLFIKMEVEILREYPYLLYDNMEAYEKTMDAYIDNSHSILTIATENNRSLGCLLATPVTNCKNVANIVHDVEKELIKHNYDPAECYYHGAILVCPTHRNKKIGCMLDAYQSLVSQNWGYKYATALIFDREDNHPLKPNNHNKNNLKFAAKMGFVNTGIKVNEVWKAMQVNGKIKKSVHEMELWIKRL